MRRSHTQLYFARSWLIAILIGAVFLGVEYALRFEIESAGGPASYSWLDLALMLCAYLFVFCLKPIQKAIQRKLCQRAAHRAPLKTAR